MDATAFQNEVVIERLLSDDPAMQKQAAQTLTDYIRVKAREDGLARAILPPITVTQADLDPQVNFEEPAIIFEKEPDTANAVTVPFAGTVDATEIEGDRYLVTFDTVRTLKKRTSKFRLMTYRNDIRQIITDLDLKEILEHEDRRFFATVDSILGGAVNTTLTSAGGVSLWQNVAGGLTPQSLVDMLQIMPQASGDFVPATIVMNQYRAMELLSWDALELGDNYKQEIVQSGFTEGQIFGKKLIITIKDDIVANDDVYLFAEPDKLGRFCVLQDATIYPDVDVDMLEWTIMECIGLTIAQTVGIAKATLT